MANTTIKQLDLHGLRHDEAERQVENFVLLNKSPLSIITGNSDKMRNIVEHVCNKHKISYERWDWGEIKIL
jgi:DNA-nicking Smr family endonuclease